MKRRLSVAIVGGGVAGAHLASLLASLDAVEVTLFEASSEYRRPCGEAVPESEVSIIVSDHVVRDVRGVKIVMVGVPPSAEYSVKRVRFPYTIGYIIDKKSFIESMRREARELGARVEYRLVTNLEDLLRDFDIVVDARGAFSDSREYDSLIAARVIVDRVEAPGNALKPSSDSITMVFYPFFLGYAWIFPSRGGWNVGIGWARRYHRVVASTWCGGTAGVDCISGILERVSGVKRVKPEASKIKIVDPVSEAVPRRYGGRLVRIGEAGGFIVPFTGEGIRPALLSAEAAYDDIASGKAPRKWPNLKRLAREFAKHHRLYRLLSRARPIVALSMLEKLTWSDILSLMEGRVSLSRLVLKLLL